MRIILTININIDIFTARYPQVIEQSARSNPLTRDQRNVCQLLLVQITFHHPEAALCVFRRNGHARHHAGDAMFASILIEAQGEFLLLAFIHSPCGRASRYLRRWHFHLRSLIVARTTTIGRNPPTKRHGTPFFQDRRSSCAQRDINNRSHRVAVNDHSLFTQRVNVLDTD